MRRISFYLLGLALLIPFAAAAAFAQDTERYTGTVVAFGSGRNTRVLTTTFTLDLRGRTSSEDAQRFLGLLQEGKQNELREELRKQSLGRFSVGPRVGVEINTVIETTKDGQRRIFAIFERWMQFAELRGGYRSVDYPYGVIELMIDPRTGKGDGTYIAAARIRWDRDDDTGDQEIEIQNFATFPARLMGVTQQGFRAP